MAVRRLRIRRSYCLGLDGNLQLPRQSLRSVAYTDCDRNGNSGCKRYAYRDGNGNGDGNSNTDPHSNTDAHTYSDSKGYSDAETSAHSPPTPVSRGYNHLMQELAKRFASSCKAE